MLHNGRLVGQGGVKHNVGLALEGGDVQFFTPADIGPHLQGPGHLGAPKAVVPDGPAGQPHPGGLEAEDGTLVHVGAGRDIQLCGLGMPAGDVVVQGVDALKDGNFVLFQFKGGAQAVIAHLPGELISGNGNLLPLGQGGKMPVQQLHVQKQGRLIVDDSLGGAGCGFGIQGDKVVVHGHGVGVDPTAAQLLGNFHGRGGFARAGRAGQQHDGAALQVGQDPVRRQRHPLGVVLVALGQKFRRITSGAPVNLL